MKPSPDEIINAVAPEFGIAPEDIRTRTRQWRISFPRQVAIWIARNRFGMRLMETARGFHVGGKPLAHKSVIHACRSIAVQVEIDHRLKDKVDRIISAIENGKA